MRGFAVHHMTHRAITLTVDHPRLPLTIFVVNVIFTWNLLNSLCKLFHAKTPHNKGVIHISPKMCWFQREMMQSRMLKKFTTIGDNGESMATPIRLLIKKNTPYKKYAEVSMD